LCVQTKVLSQKLEKSQEKPELEKPKRGERIVQKEEQASMPRKTRKGDRGRGAK